MNKPARVVWTDGTYRADVLDSYKGPRMTQRKLAKEEALEGTE